jgi:hypothetical protein
MLRANIVAACGAICAPLWLPTLHQVSAACAEIAPVAGLAALAINTVLVIRREFGRGRP